MWVPRFGIGTLVTGALVALLEGGAAAAALRDLAASVAGSRAFTWGLAYCVVGQTVVNYTLLTYANRALASSTVALYACAQPVLAVAIERAAFGTPVAVPQLAGMALLVAGLSAKLRADAAAAAREGGGSGAERGGGVVVVDGANEAEVQHLLPPSSRS